MSISGLLMLTVDIRGDELSLNLGYVECLLLEERAAALVSALAETLRGAVPATEITAAQCISPTSHGRCPSAGCQRMPANGSQAAMAAVTMASRSARVAPSWAWIDMPCWTVV